MNHYLEDPGCAGLTLSRANCVTPSFISLSDPAIRDAGNSWEVDQITGPPAPRIPGGEAPQPSLSRKVR